ncbi:MAG: NAD(P)/FAD-dependent oxidoreductase [Geodermatophilaceae bacterium]|nr:NAD(P)/FAD-dependent oxidoreductase [Geodermatophilaceae bacterium]
MTEPADAIVIGAGHNGLVAANILVDAGWRVVVLEATAHPGGAIRTAEVTAPGFHSDLYSAFYPLGYASPVLTGLRLEEYGLEWARSPSVLSHVLPDGRAVTLHTDIEQTAASVGSFAATDGPAWKSMYEEWQRIGPAVIAALFRPFPPVRSAFGLLRALGSSAELLRFLRFAVLPVRRLGEERFDGEGARLLLAGNALHTDLAPEGAISAVFGWLLAMLGQQVGFPVPRGGSERLVDALVARLETRGGVLHCSTPVRSVVVRDGRARGVRTEDGEEFTARRAVLADVPAPVLYQRLVADKHLPPRLLQDLENFQWDNATIKVDWALSGVVPWSEPTVAGSGTVHLGGDMDGLTRYAADLATRTVPTSPFLLFGQMAAADPSRCPPGTEVAWAYTHIPWQAGLSADAVAQQVDRMEAVIEQAAPGFRRRIVGRHVASPQDLERGDPSLVGGAINGGTAALHQQLIFRPVPGLGRPETPVKGLYLASASAHPGGGVHGGPGANAATVALRRTVIQGRLKGAGTDWALRRVYR